MTKSAFLPVFCSVFLVSATAGAQTPPAPFGARGSVVVDRLLQYDSATGTYGMLGFSIHRSEENGNVASSKVDQRNITFAPAADWFPIRNLSVGLAASISHWNREHEYQPYTPSKQTSDGTVLAVRPRVGYVLPLTTELSLWPRAWVGYQRSTHSDLALGAAGVPFSGWSAAIGLPLIVTPSRNLFFAVGPELRWESTRDDKLTNPDGSFGSATRKRVELAMMGGLGLVFGR